MFSLDGTYRYWLYNKPVDMRKSFNGLGGICGKAASGTIKDCYCRNSKVTDTKGSSFVITNGIIVDKAVKNGTADFSPTLSNGRSLSNVKLFNALTQGSYSGSSGTTALTFTSAPGTAEALSTWTTYESGENAFESGSVFFVSLPCGNGRRGCGRGRGCPLFSLP